MYRIEHLYWEDERAPKAAGAGNDRDLGPAKRWRFMSNCRHWRQRFELEKGISVYASAWLDRPDAKLFRRPAGFWGPPEIGLYFDVKWASDRLVLSPGFRPPFRKEKADARMILYPWRDYGLPERLDLFVDVLEWVLTQSAKGKTVEIGCMGGHGRTGTALASLLVLQGLTPTEAIRRVWGSYCEEAIESEGQLSLIRSLA